MKPNEKKKLLQARNVLLEILDEKCLVKMMEDGQWSGEEMERVLEPPTYLEKNSRFLNLLETKSNDSFDQLCLLIQSKNPHLFLLLSGWSDNKTVLKNQEKISNESYEPTSSYWHLLLFNRDYLLNQMEPIELSNYLKKNSLLNEKDIEEIKKEKNKSYQFEKLLWKLENKPQSNYNLFLDVVGDVYPHLYESLTKFKNNK